MDIFEITKETINLVYHQIYDFVEVVRLKLRIIGFSNKRSGLFTKLGEMTYKAIRGNRPIAEDPEIKRVVEEILLAEGEIADAEVSIEKRKEKALEDRERFRKKIHAIRAARQTGASSTVSFSAPPRDEPAQPTPEQPRQAAAPGPVVQEGEKETGGASEDKAS